MLRSAQSTLTALVLFVLLGSSPVLLAQPQEIEEGQPKFWKLKGFRHGKNYFPITNLVETTPKVEGEWDFEHYHMYDEMLVWFDKWTKEYPDLIDLYVGGVSLEGRDIMQLTLTNKKTGADTDKPAMMIDANRHAGEVTAGESALWQLHYMLTNYGKDPDVTYMVDNFAFYFRPRNNPDGSLLYFNTAQSLRSTTRPTDNDGDGLLDEDPGDDLDGDGFTRQMRVKVPRGEGQFIIDPRDPKGRLMIRAPQGEGEYNVMTEGIDNDGDGRVNEDGIGGLDLHRNYPENWRPMPGRDRTGRGWTQSGAGEFPLSEPETRSLVIFILEHPNIAAANSMDTSVPMHLRGPSTSRSDERMFPEDLALFKVFDQRGLKISGYGRAGDVYQDYGGGRPLFGHGPDFGYWYFGSIWYGDELWDGGRFVGDYNGDGEDDDLDNLEYGDNELKKSRFQEWTKTTHPTLGDVEVGGWNPKFWRQNPPPELLEVWAEKQARFNLMLGMSLPKIEMSEPTVTGNGNGDYIIEVSVENMAIMPTALLQAQLVKIVRPDTITLDVADGRLIRRGGFGRGRGRGRGARGGRGGGGGGRGGRGRGGFAGQQQPQQPQEGLRIVEPASGSPTIDIDRLRGYEKKTITYHVKLEGITGTRATIRYSSTRGGVISKEIFIGSRE